jgi:hypothetical protein
MNAFDSSQGQCVTTNLWNAGGDPGVRPFPAGRCRLRERLRRPASLPPRRGPCWTSRPAARFPRPDSKENPMETVPLQPLVALIAGVLILIVPRILNYVVALYLIIAGLLGLFPNAFA